MTMPLWGLGVYKTPIYLAKFLVINVGIIPFQGIAFLVKESLTHNESWNVCSSRNTDRYEKRFWRMFVKTSTDPGVT